MMTKNEGTWVRHQVDADTHGALYQLKLKLKSSGKGKYLIEELASEATKLGLPLLEKKLGVK